MGLADSWDLECRGNLKVTEIFGLSNLQDGVAAHRDERGCERS